MEISSETINLLVLFLIAIPVGVFAIVIGASQFLSIPIFQLFFPQMTLGGIVGNLRIGNMARDAIALIPVRKDINIKPILTFIIVACIGSVLGTLVTANIPQSWLVVVLISAFAITEVAPWISAHVPKYALVFAFFLAGVYYGVIGAGGSVIVMAFLRIKFSKDSEIHSVRVNMLLLEFLAFVVSVIAFVLSGTIDWTISLTWAAGAIIGGYIGGKVLVRVGKTSARTQKFSLRIVATVAIVIAVWRAFFS